mmetsp:Transcript_1149/g.1774  ORF Transcript_1149/g.1774 Transcript_1149/m.1774 type:complete len:325 (-) Transcript_1149:56-1030(-)
MLDLLKFKFAMILGFSFGNFFIRADNDKFPGDTQFSLISEYYQPYSATSKCILSEESDWTYNSSCTYNKDSQVGPKEWYKLYPDCQGHKQSPVNLSAKDVTTNCSYAPKGNALFEFFSESCKFGDLAYFATSHSWQVNFDRCSLPPAVMVNGVDYDLLQFHFHSVSEHTTGGAHSDGELHMVHASQQNADEYLVIAVMFNANHNIIGNSELDSYWFRLASLSKRREGKYPSYIKTDQELADPYSLLPPDLTYFTYAGSLTTPPCTESVTWFVLANAVSMSPGQLDLFRYDMKRGKETLVDANGNTNRPTQPLNGRQIFQCTFNS